MGRPIKLGGFEYARGRIIYSSPQQQEVHGLTWTQIHLDQQQEAGNGLDANLPNYALIIPGRGEYLCSFSVTADGEPTDLWTNVSIQFRLDGVEVLTVGTTDSAWRRRFRGDNTNQEYWYWGYANLSKGNLTTWMYTTLPGQNELVGVEANAHDVRTAMEVARVG